MFAWGFAKLRTNKDKNLFEKAKIQITTCLILQSSTGDYEVTGEGHIWAS